MFKNMGKVSSLHDPSEEYTLKYSHLNRGKGVCYGNYIPKNGVCVRDKFSWEIP